MKITLNPKFSYLQSFVDNIESHFEASSNVLHNQRNEIRVITYKNENYVVKAFRLPNIVNRIAYRYFRSSKAKRSYEYSIKVGAELCPEAVAYIEEKKGLLLFKSYYISKHYDYDFEIRALLKDKSFENRTQILEEFAEFTHVLHEKNILHRDYSPGNILIKQAGKHYQFKIVDVNRMQFKALTMDERLSNFVRLSVDDKTMKTILYQYARCIQQDPKDTFEKAKQFSAEYESKRALKNKLRGR